MSGFLGGSVVKNPPDNEGDMGLIPGPGRATVQVTLNTETETSMKVKYG